MRCRQCGKCCRWLLIGIRDFREVDTDFVKARGLKIVDVGDFYVALYATGPKCKHLGKDNKCKIYEDRPKSCKKYPQNLLVTIPGCGYNDDI